MSFAPGTRLDRYTVEGILGQGGMAVVYKVRHVQLGTTHALKVLNTPSPQIRERMIREGRVQGSLRHPNIVPVTDLVEISGSPGLVMEYVDGPTMEALLERYRPTLAQSDALATAILEGVAHAHRKGFIHRDLKPANVLLANTSMGLTPKVADFGLAKLIHSDEPDGLHHTRSGVVMGTPAYMAPEQIRDSKHVDQRADVFSLGVMLYELLAGKKPFIGDDIVKLYTAITNGTYIPLRTQVPDVPERMERAITGALALDRNARIQDCDRLLAIWRGDTSARRESTAQERAASQIAGTAVPDLPEPFFPETSGDAEKEITFHDGGTAVVGGAPVTRDHWLLADLSRLRIASPDIGAIDPNSDVPDEPRVIIPVEPGARGRPSLDPNDSLSEPEPSFAPRGGMAIGLASVALVSVLLGIGIALAYGGLTASDAAPIVEPSVEAPIVAPPTPTPTVRPRPRPPSPPANPRVAPSEAIVPPVDVVPLEILEAPPPLIEPPLVVVDEGIAPDATPPVEAPPAETPPPPPTREIVIVPAPPPVDTPPTDR